MEDIRFYRVLQHDTMDQIRIGAAYPSDNLDKSVKSVISQYDSELNWCGGFEVGCDKYYKRIAIVDAESLAVVRMIYQKNEDK